jgi:hypothetical protein
MPQNLITILTPEREFCYHLLVLIRIAEGFDFMVSGNIGDHV